VSPRKRNPGKEGKKIKVGDVAVAQKKLKWGGVEKVVFQRKKQVNILGNSKG